jgi:hypothetical protein
MHYLTTTSSIYTFYSDILYTHIQGYSKWLSGCGHLVLQMQPHVISFCGVTSRIRFMFLLFPQVSRNWRHESEPPLKPSPLTCKQFETNSIIVLMVAESKRCSYRAPVRYGTKSWSVVLLNEKIHILLSQMYCVRQVVKTPTIILNNSVLRATRWCSWSKHCTRRKVAGQ